MRRMFEKSMRTISCNARYCLTRFEAKSKEQINVTFKSFALAFSCTQSQFVGGNPRKNKFNFLISICPLHTSCSSPLDWGTEEQNCFFRNGVKNYTEFYTDCRNFQALLINQKLNVKLVMMTSWRSVTSLKNAWITDSGKARSTLRLSEARKLVCFIEMELCAAHDMCPTQPRTAEKNLRFV